MAVDEMVRQHHQLSGRESEESPGHSDRQRSLVCRMQSMGLQRVRYSLVTEQQKSLFVFM